MRVNNAFCKIIDCFWRKHKGDSPHQRGKVLRPMILDDQFNFFDVYCSEVKYHERKKGSLYHELSKLSHTVFYWENTSTSGLICPTSCLFSHWWVNTYCCKTKQSYSKVERITKKRMLIRIQYSGFYCAVKCDAKWKVLLIKGLIWVFGVLLVGPIQINLHLSNELMMWIVHRKDTTKPTFRALAFRQSKWQRANAW